MSDLYSRTDLFSEFDRLQRQMESLFGGLPSSLRSSRFGAFPQINIGTTDDSIEIVVFAPGVDVGGLDFLFHGAHAGEHAEDGADGAHFADLAELGGVILERKNALHHFFG